MQRTINTLALLAVAAACAHTPALHAQEKAQAPSPVSCFGPDAANCVVKTYHLRNVQGQTSANEILIALRNTLDPSVHVFLVVSQNDIVLFATPEQQAVAEHLLSELDKPTRSFRLTFTVTATDSGKTVGVQHYAMVALAGQRTTMKVGNKVPLLTGIFTKDNGGSQFQYIDTGMNFDVTIDPVLNGALIKSKVEQSNSASESTIADVHEPIINQTVFEGSAILSDGKPLMLGSLDVPGTTRHYDISVMEEPLP